MPGTTVNGLPYPVGTDRLTDGAAKIQQLAEGVDGKLLVPWTLAPITWVGATTNPNKGSTGTCDVRTLRRGHTVDFAFRLTTGGTGFALGSGNYSWQTMPFPAFDFDRYSFAVITTNPNRQYFAKFTSVSNIVIYKVGGTGIFAASDATTDGWVNGVTIGISGSYETT